MERSSHVDPVAAASRYSVRMTVKLAHISKSYGAIRAVIDVTVELDAGAISIIEGPNGSGKSTLLGVIGTLIRPSAGSIDYGLLGKSVAEVRASLGWLGHDTLCYPDLTGRENVELAARLAGVKDVGLAWQQMADRFAVSDLRARTMRVASRGQRQRIALARALVRKPDLLLLDEPSTGLDQTSVNRIAAVLEEESRRGATVVVVTHDKPFVKRLNSKLFQMDRGRISQATR
jgi:ABC-type multidrug transport system ATPase subunit